MIPPVAAALIAAVVAVQPPLTPPAAQEPDGAAAITGRVVDKPSGAPIARAVVTVRNVKTQRAIQKVTNTDGRFIVSGLAAGSYQVAGSPADFRATHVASRYGRALQIQLKGAETQDVAIALERAYAISGRVLDEAGLPLSGIRLNVRSLPTESTFFGFRGNATDDLGEFRLFGLGAGRYVLCAEGNSSPTFQRTSEAKEVRFVRTCYPSVPEESESQAVTLRDADVEGVEIRMRRNRTFTISGVVTDSSGSPAESYVLGLTRLVRDGSSGMSQRLQSSAFTISDVVPGKYVVSAEIGPDPSPSSAPKERGRVQLEITSEDVEGLVLTMKKGAAVRGVVTFEDGPPADMSDLRLQIAPEPVESFATAGRRSGADVQPNLTFELKDLFGPYVLMMNGLPTGYATRSIVYRNRDINGISTEFDQDPRTNTVEVVITRRVAELSGKVLDDRGNPAAGVAIEVFPADAARWLSWRPGGSRTNRTGDFRIRNFVPGEYLIVAVPIEDLKAVSGNDWFRANRYEKLATLAERVMLLDNDRRVLDLRVTPIPQEWKR